VVSVTGDDQRGLTTPLPHAERLFSIAVSESAEVRHDPFAAAWQRAVDIDGGQEMPRGTLHSVTPTRTIAVPRSSRRAAMFSVDDLCGSGPREGEAGGHRGRRSPLGPSDYLSLSKVFPTLFVTALRPLSLNEARRWMGLVDVYYERRGLIVVESTVPSSEIMGGANVRLGDSRGDTDKMADKDEDEHLPLELLNATEAPAGTAGKDTTRRSWARGDVVVSRGELGAALDTSFAFARAQSRLVEMHSVEYVGAHAMAWLGGAGSITGKARA
jgi:predicted ATPase